MKTTLELAAELVSEAKRASRRNDLDLRSLIERGLRNELRRRQERDPSPAWKPQSYGDPEAETWLKAPFRDEDWAAIKAASYERGPSD